MADTQLGTVEVPIEETECSQGSEDDLSVEYVREERGNTPSDSGPEDFYDAEDHQHEHEQEDKKALRTAGSSLADLADEYELAMIRDPINGVPIRSRSFGIASSHLNDDLASLPGSLASLALTTESEMLFHPGVGTYRKKWDLRFYLCDLRNQKGKYFELKTFSLPVPADLNRSISLFDLIKKISPLLKPTLSENDEILIYRVKNIDGNKTVGEVDMRAIHFEINPFFGCYDMRSMLILRSKSRAQHFLLPFVIWSCNIPSLSSGFCVVNKDTLISEMLDALPMTKKMNNKALKVTYFLTSKGLFLDYSTTVGESNIDPLSLIHVHRRKPIKVDGTIYINDNYRVYLTVKPTNADTVNEMKDQFQKLFQKHLPHLAESNFKMCLTKQPVALKNATIVGEITSDVNAYDYDEFFNDDEFLNLDGQNVSPHMKHSPHLKHSPQLQCDVHFVQDSFPIIVNVKTLPGHPQSHRHMYRDVHNEAKKQIVIFVRPEMNILELKRNVALKTGFPVASQNLVMNKSMLSDTKTASFYGIKKGGSIDITCEQAISVDVIIDNLITSRLIQDEIRIYKNSTIKDLIEMICSRLRHTVAKLKLSTVNNEGRVNVDYNKTLKTLDIDDKSVICLTYFQNLITLKVKFRGESLTTMSLQDGFSNMTVLNLKTKICETFGHHVNQINVVLNGQCLHDNVLVEDYELKEGDTLAVTPIARHVPVISLGVIFRAKDRPSWCIEEWVVHRDQSGHVKFLFELDGISIEEIMGAFAQSQPFPGSSVASTKTESRETMHETTSFSRGTNSADQSSDEKSSQTSITSVVSQEWTSDINSKPKASPLDLTDVKKIGLNILKMQSDSSDHEETKAERPSTISYISRRGPFSAAAPSRRPVNSRSSRFASDVLVNRSEATASACNNSLRVLQHETIQRDVLEDPNSGECVVQENIDRKSRFKNRDDIPKYTSGAGVQTSPYSYSSSDNFDLTSPEPEHVVSPKVLSKISPELGKDWKKVARNLDFKDYEIDHFDHRNQNDLTEKSGEMLRTWHRKMGHKATRQSLNDALEESGLRSVSNRYNLSSESEYEE